MLTGASKEASIAIMSNQTVTDITRSGGRARLAQPLENCHAGVILLPSVVGLNQATDDLLVRLADAGFTALAWDPFFTYAPNLTREEKGRLSASVFDDTVLQREHSGWIDYMQQDLGVAKVGVIGFCMGGRMSLVLAAADRRLRACVAFYPSIRDPKPAKASDVVALAANIACPVQIHYPGLDYVTSNASFQKLRTALEARPDPAPSCVHYYPQANHGFLGKTHEESPADAAAGTIAWPTTVAFLRAALLDAG